MAAFSLPELLPNKWRHIGVVIADIAVFVAVIIAPVTARYGFEWDTWEWKFWALAVAQGLSFLGLLLLYFPPYHPYVPLLYPVYPAYWWSWLTVHRNGISYMSAFKSLDYVGEFLPRAISDSF